MPARRSSRSSLRPMLVTIWMCTHEWSLIWRRVTALTLAACHSAFSESSLFARSTMSRSRRLPRAGRLIRMSRTASVGVMRAPRSARTLTGVPGGGSDPAGASSGSGAGCWEASIRGGGYRTAGSVPGGQHVPAEREGVVEPAGGHRVERDAVTVAVAVDRPAVAQVDTGVVDRRVVRQGAVRRAAPEDDVAGPQRHARDPPGVRQVVRHVEGRAPRDGRV